MRWWCAIAAAVLLSAIAPAAADPGFQTADVTLVGSKATILFALPGAEGDPFLLSIVAARPVDLFLVDASNASRMTHGERFFVQTRSSWENLTDDILPLEVPPGGPWQFGVAYHGTESNATTHVRAELWPDDPFPEGGGFFSAITFQKGYWMATPTLGIHGIVLWLGAVALACAWLVRRTAHFVALWVAISIGACFLASRTTTAGVFMETGVPVAMAVISAFALRQRVKGPFERHAATFLVAFLGPLVGADILSLTGGDSALGTGVIGGAGWKDGLFNAPWLAFCLVFLLDRGQVFQTRRQRGARRLDGICGKCRKVVRLTKAQAEGILAADSGLVPCPACATQLQVTWQDVTRNPSAPIRTFAVATDGAVQPMQAVVVPVVATGQSGMPTDPKVEAVGDRASEQVPSGPGSGAP